MLTNIKFENWRLDESGVITGIENLQFICKAWKWDDLMNGMMNA